MIFFIKQRDTDFLAACMSIMERHGGSADYKLIAAEAALTRPPRYYIASAASAARIVRDFRAGRLTRSRSLPLWAELSERAAAIQAKRGISLSRPVEIAICDCAPSSFHLSPQAAYRLLLSLTRQTRAKREALKRKPMTQTKPKSPNL